MNISDGLMPHWTNEVRPDTIHDAMIVWCIVVPCGCRMRRAPQRDLICQRSMCLNIPSGLWSTHRIPHDWRNCFTRACHKCAPRRVVGARMVYHVEEMRNRCLPPPQPLVAATSRPGCDVLLHKMVTSSPASLTRCEKYGGKASKRAPQGRRLSSCRYPESGQSHTGQSESLTFGTEMLFLGSWLP